MVAASNFLRGYCQLSSYRHVLGINCGFTTSYSRHRSATFVMTSLYRVDAVIVVVVEVLWVRINRWSATVHCRHDASRRLRHPTAVTAVHVEYCHYISSRTFNRRIGRRPTRLLHPRRSLSVLRLTVRETANDEETTPLIALSSYAPWQLCLDTLTSVRINKLTKFCIYLFIY